jgi:predicted DNA-binding protein (MmcQ/YjbR family)
MRGEDLLAECLAKPGAWPDQPWEHDTVVKVGPKIFAFLGRIGPESDGVPGGMTVGLKCGPNRDVADEWLARYPDDARLMPYIGRHGWNSLTIGGAIPDEEILEAVEASYAAVASKLPKRERPS